MRILHAADLHLREDPPYGQLDPATGLNTRFLDQRRLLMHLAGIAVDEEVDAVLISGDVFHHRRPTPLVYTVAQEAIDWILAAKIPVIITGGNHDGDPAAGQVSAVHVLENRAQVIAAGPRVDIIETRSGSFQLFALPHIPRSRLLASDAYKDLSPEAAYQVLANKAHDLLRAMQAQRDRDRLSVVMAHASVAGARLGSEQAIGFGNEVVLDLHQLEDLDVDLVALGHIHRAQQLAANIAYAGAMYRVSFDEEREEKGVWIHDLTLDGVRSEWIDLGDRPYVTQHVAESTFPVSGPLKGAIVRIVGELTPENLALLNPGEICRSLVESHGAHSVAWQVQTTRAAAVRVAGMTETIGPAAALDLYLAQHPELPADPLRERGRSLIAGQSIDGAASLPSRETAPSVIGNAIDSGVAKPSFPAAAPTSVEVAR